MRKEAREKKAKTKGQIAKGKKKELGAREKDANECKKSVDGSKLFLACNYIPEVQIGLPEP